MDVESLISELIAREGAYVDHKADRGGATRFGITERVARANGYSGAMSELPLATARDIYRALYWNKPGLDRVARRAPRLAAELFDTAANMGPAIAISFLQRALNALNRNARDFADVRRDGRIGPATLAALDLFLRRRGTPGERVLVKAVEALQGARYIAIAEHRPANEAFVYGWLAHRLGNTPAAQSPTGDA
jgi:lysozyme family protein